MGRKTRRKMRQGRHGSRRSASQRSSRGVKQTRGTRPRFGGALRRIRRADEDGGNPMPRGKSQRPERHEAPARRRPHGVPPPGLRASSARIHRSHRAKRSAPASAPERSGRRTGSAAVGAFRRPSGTSQPLRGASCCGAMGPATESRCRAASGNGPARGGGCLRIAIAGPGGLGYSTPAATWGVFCPADRFAATRAETRCIGLHRGVCEAA